MNLLFTQATVLLAESSSDEGSGGIGLLFLLSGFVFYGAMYLRYRNTDKHHKHESETEARMLDVRAVDNHIKTLKGVKNARLQGANNRLVRARGSNVLGDGIPPAVAAALGSIPGMGSLRPGNRPPGAPPPPPPPAI